MKYLKTYKESISQHSFDINEIRYIVNDALVDLVQNDMEIYVMGHPNIHSSFNVVINRKSRGVLFSFNDIKDSINILISLLSSEYFELDKAEYYMDSSDRKPIGITPKYLKWFSISMDPTSGEVSGEGIINVIKDGVNISDEKCLSMFKMSFSEFNNYVEESDSWAGSLYAYDRYWKKSNTPTEIVELPTRKVSHYRCNDCGVDFDSFIKECTNCKSDNVELVQ